MQKSYIIILILFISILGLIIILPVEYLLNYAHDDSFFYVKTAYNFASGYGSTFDKLNITNGYHLLWFIVLVLSYFPVYFLFGDILTPESIFKYTFVIVVIIIIINVLLIKKLWENLCEKKYKYTFFILILLLTAFVFIRDVGMESHLNCMLISLFIYITVLNNKKSEYNYILKSLIVSLLFLGRFDYLISIIPPLVLSDVFLSYPNMRKRIKPLFIYIILLGFSGILYLSANYLISGHIISISSQISNSFPDVLFIDNLKVLITTKFKFYNQFVRIIIIALSVIVITILLLRDKSSKNKIYYLLYFMNIGSLVYIIINISFNKFNIREWYMTFPIYVSFLSITLIFREYLSKLVLFIPVLLFAILTIYQTRIINQKFINYYMYSKELEKHTNEDEFIFQIDGTGVIGFFSNRNVVNGDGLINSYEYYNYLKSGNILSYLRKYRIYLYSSYNLNNYIDDNDFYDQWFKLLSPHENVKFDKKELVFKFPYYWGHSVFETNGEWYLFRKISWEE